MFGCSGERVSSQLWTSDWKVVHNLRSRVGIEGRETAGSEVFSVLPQTSSALSIISFTSLPRKRPGLRVSISQTESPRTEKLKKGSRSSCWWRWGGVNHHKGAPLGWEILLWDTDFQIKPHPGSGSRLLSEEGKVQTTLRKGSERA